jgi:alkanesulfonate monooxygenase SsuD/methylene tetrahydromethanopterin reductase-like flavin-dependent oxidoreductase (luciferase family)
MKLGVLTLQNRPWNELVDSWVHLDGLGVDSIWVADHLANPMRPERPWLEGWTCLAALAAATGSARVGALVSSMVLRNPATLAKAAITLDHVSDGRAELALGAGGAPFDIELAGEPPYSFSQFVGRVVAVLGDETLQPRPLQPLIPLTIGGQSRTALELAARHADRWNTYGGHGISPEEAIRVSRERNQHVNRLCDEHGRDPATLTRSILIGYPFVGETPWRSVDAFQDLVERWSGAGFDELIVYYPPETGMPEGSVEPGVFERAVELVRKG